MAREEVATDAATLVVQVVEATTEEATIAAAAAAASDEAGALLEVIHRSHFAATIVLAQLTLARNASTPFNST